jgi:hypothetical protein
MPIPFLIILREPSLNAPKITKKDYVVNFGTYKSNGAI